MRDAQECLAKAKDMEEAAEECPFELAAVYHRLAADWLLLAHQAEWQVKFLSSARPPMA
jgi:hypothetical protein